MTPQQTLIFHMRAKLSRAHKSTSNRAVSRCFIPKDGGKTLASPSRVAHWHAGGGARIENVIEAAELVGLELALVDKAGARVLVDVESGEVI